MTVGAIDIGGTKIAVGVVDENGRILSKLKVPTDPHNYRRGLALIVEMLQKTAEDAGVEISGIGIGSTGPVDPLAGKFGELDFLPGWRGKNVVDDLERIFKVSVALENDGDAAVLGEAAWGIGKTKTRLVYVTIGTGIGGGIVLDGKLYRGVDGSHPELGHQILDPLGPICSCGFRGCWEALAAGPAMVAWMKSQMPPNYAYREGLTAERVCELAKQGDELAGRAVEREAHYLGLGLANLINILTPDAIVLSGSVMKSADLFMDRIRGVIRGGCAFVPSEKTELVPASLREDANLAGAARVWHHRFAQRKNGIA